MRCAARGSHVHWSIWEPRIEESLQMKSKYANVQDPFTVAITASLQKIFTAYDAMGHVPSEISQFSYNYNLANYKGLAQGLVSNKIILFIHYLFKYIEVLQGAQKLERTYLLRPLHGVGNKKLKVQSEMEEQCANGDLKEFDLTGDVETIQKRDAEVYIKSNY